MATERREGRRAQTEMVALLFLSTTTEDRAVIRTHESVPRPVCLSLKFSSGNCDDHRQGTRKERSAWIVQPLEFVPLIPPPFLECTLSPQMLFPPVPSPRVKSPPWIMNWEMIRWKAVR